ncbi:MAG: OmpA family protein [Alphaproteobacteria bacterium]|nr:OmpA family protein [Alphaproteobacteria bacterium]
MVRNATAVLPPNLYEWGKSMKLHRLIPCLTAVLLAAGCSGIAEPMRTDSHNLRPHSDVFQQTLADGYRKLGQFEDSTWHWDYIPAQIFYEKSVMAGNGQPVPVGDPIEWNVRRSHPPMFGHYVVGFSSKRTLDTALDYRARLSAWIAANKARDPVTTAQQQVAFECWLEQMAEDDYEEVQFCGLNPALWVVAQQTQAPPPAPAPAPAARTYLVFFDFDRSDITPEAAAIIRQAADDAKRQNVRLIVATGHADRSGPTDYNQRLSERRAASVRAALVREGIPANTIQTSGRGENDNLVATADGVREPRNRRVEIAFR